MFFQWKVCFRQALNFLHCVVPFAPPWLYFIRDISLPNRSVFFQIRLHLTQSPDLTKIAIFCFESELTQTVSWLFSVHRRDRHCVRKHTVTGTVIVQQSKSSIETVLGQLRCILFSGSMGPMPNTNPNKRTMHIQKVISRGEKQRGRYLRLWSYNARVIYAARTVTVEVLGWTEVRLIGDWSTIHRWTHYSCNILQIHFYMRFLEIS